MTADVALLGCGKMGSAMVRRLASMGHRVIAWNRTAAAAETLATESPNCAAAPTAVDAIAGVADGPVILMLANIPAVQELLAQPAVRAALAGKTLVNIVSGNPDEGRAVAASVAGVAAVCIDGAYSGAPTKALAGAGQVFVSSDDGGAAVERCRPILESLGKVTFSGKVGSARALDYAVVDLAMANYLSHCANLAMLEREGVDPAQFASEASFRLATCASMLEKFEKRSRSRDEAAYLAEPSATLGTWRNFWGSRLPYFEAHGLPAAFPKFVVGLLDEAGASGAHKDADVTRLQEVVRYGAKAE